ncbi:hypothetical protein NUACC26_051500 [Scytonema sp. NUACC26]
MDTIAGKTVVLTGASGAVNSAALLLRSPNDRHPNGLANSSRLVGRNYMAHKFAIALALSTKQNTTVYQKTLASNDFYWGEKDFPYPMGSIQLLGNLNKDRIATDAPLVPGV